MAPRIEWLEDRVTPAPLASITGLPSTNPLLGETVSYSFTFTNTATNVAGNTGFSPFIEVAVDTSGPDGVGPLPADLADGFGTPTVSVAGLQLNPVGTPIVLSTGQTTYVNPFTGDTRPVPAGFGLNDTIYVYQLPFGSFNPSQATSGSITLSTSNRADVGTPLNLAVTGGYRDVDAVSPFTPVYGSTVTTTATPELYRLKKIYLGPEDETATGPNFPRRYRIEVDIAAGQTIRSLSVTDDLASSMQITGRTSARQAAYLASSGLSTNVFATANAGGTATTTLPDGTVSYAFGNVTGVDGLDAAFEFEFYVPRDRATGTQVLPQSPTTGTDSVTDVNTASSAGLWNPLDTRDPQNQVVNKTAPDNGPHTLQEQSLATQKTVTATDINRNPLPTGSILQPGQTLLRYDVAFQVSDYYAFQNVILQDLLGDGQRLYLGASGTGTGADAAFMPTLSVNNAYQFATGGGTRTNTTGSFSSTGSILYRQQYSSNAGSNPIGYPVNGPTTGVFSNDAPAIDTNVNSGGTTFLQFNISQELAARLSSGGRLVGGEISNTGTGPTNNPFPTPQFSGTTGVITFYAIITNEFSDAFPSGDRSVDQGDVLGNSVPLIRGDQIAPSTINAAVPTVIGTGTDDSASSVSIPYGTQQKTVYAINSTLIPTQTSAETVYSLQVGDRVTYKLTYTLPVSRFEGLQFIDFPPLPIIPIGAAGLYSFIRNPGAYAFGSNTIGVAPDDTFFSTFDPTQTGVRNPTISTDPNSNALIMSFGNFEDTQARPTTISLLITFTINSNPFVSDLFLTNQFRVNEGSTNSGTSTVEDLRRFELVRPFVTIQKGAVGGNTTGLNAGGIAFQPPSNATGTFTIGGNAPSSTNALSTTAQATSVGGLNISPANVTLDAGDSVRYAIVVQNTGRGDAYDVTVSDTVPANYIRPATVAGLNLRVLRGDGTLLVLGTDYTLTYDNTTGTFAVTLIDNYTAGNSNSAGISLDNRSGALSRGSAAVTGTGATSPITNGSNTVIILYDVTLPAGGSGPNANTSILNTASVPVYSSSEGGPDLTDPNVLAGATDPTDPATVLLRSPTITKTLVGTEFNTTNNPNTSAVIGELVTYTVTATIPEGITPGASIFDQLDAGLAFVQVLSATASPALSFSGGGLPGIGASTTNISVTNNGNQIRFNFGTITNTDNDNTTPQTITITYQVVVTNVVGNQAGGQRNNQADFQFTNQPGTAIRASANNVTIIEPVVTVTKTSTVNGVVGAAGDAGDPVAYSIVIAAPTGPNAFDATFNDPLPLSGAGSAIVGTAGSTDAPAFTVTDSAGLLTVNDFEIVGTFATGFTLRSKAGVTFDIDNTRTITLGVTGFISSTAITNTTVTNSAFVPYTSLDAPLGDTARSTFTTTSVERTGADGFGGTLNDYVARGQASFQVLAFSPTKTIVATSEASTVETGTGTTASPRLTAVGEVVRYRLAVQIAEGTTPSTQFLDVLPAGLTYLGDARIAFVSNSGYTTAFGAGANVVGNAADLTNLPSSSVAFALPVGNITQAGQTITFTLGDLVNNDRDVDGEFAVLEFNALTANVLSNQSGTNLDNSFTVRVNGTQSGLASNVVRTQVVEPVINNLAQTVSATTADAADIVTVTSTFSNTGNATAFDVVYSDPLPAALILDPTVTVRRNGTVITTGFTLTTTGNTVTVTLDQVAVGDVIRIDYPATLAQSVAPNQVINTLATVTYTSLPGPTGTAINPTNQATPGTSGAANGERNGTTAPSNLNDYVTTDPATITVPNGVLVKSLFDTSVTQTTGTSVAVGENVTYLLTVTLPEGTVPTLTLVDSLPAGMQYVSAVVDTTGFSGTVPAPTITGGASPGAAVTLTFSNVVVTGDNTAGNNTFVVRIQARVLNVPGNEGILPGQTNLPNTATLTAGGTPVPGGTVTVTVVEPQLQVVKARISADGTVDAGAPVTYRLVISHTAASSGPAFDIAVADNLNAQGLVLDPATISAVGATILSNSSTANLLSLVLDQLALGSSITITFQASVIAPPTVTAPAPGASVTNTATVGYDTIPGTNPDQRTEPQLTSNPVTIIVNTNSLAGNIYRDLNNNGNYEPGSGETLITASTTIRLTGTDIYGQIIDTSIVTTTGTYQFTGLRPGSYTLTQTVEPTGFLDGRDDDDTLNPFGGSGSIAVGTSTITNITIPADSNTSGVNYNFGELPPASVGDRVWEDLNGNGILDTGEPGINGVTVTLTGSDDRGPIAPLTTTTATLSGLAGSYGFTNLRPGTYQVTFGNTNGVVTYQYTVRDSTVTGANDTNDSDADRTTGQTVTFPLTAGQNDPTRDAGLVQPVTIGDTVYYDTNGDATQNGTVNRPEPGIPNVTVTLDYAGPDGIFGNGDDQLAVASRVTDANGNYSFAGFLPGSYRVNVLTATLPSGITTATTPTTQATGLLTSGSTDLARDFGFRGVGTVGDRVFLDVNNNGLYDPGEGINGVTVRLAGDLDGNGTVEADELFTTVTSGDGFYLFTDLRAPAVGTAYTVTVDTTTLPAGVVNTVDPNGGNDSTSSALISAGSPNNLLQDFGYRGPGAIGDTIFLDVNNNGVADAGEGITGVTVSITGDFDGDGTPTTLTTVTNATGIYGFSGLRVTPVGVAYTINVNPATLPATVATTPTFDPDGVRDNTTISTLTTTTPTDLTRDFGYRGPGSIGDTIFLDVNNNGVADPGEGIANVTVTLTADMDNDGLPETVTTTTDTNGVYSFSGLPVGNVAYTVAVVTSSLPAGLTNTFDPDGGNNSTSVVTLTGAAPVNLAQDFGYRGPGSVGDTIFLDVNNNGVADAGEGITGVTVTLTADFDGDGDLTTVTTTTDVNGVYGFSGLRVTPVGVAYTVNVNTATLPATVVTTPTVDPDGVRDNQSVAILTTALPSDLTRDFGYRGPGSIGDTIFLDVNNNGVADPGEGIANVTVTLTADMDNDGLPETVTTTTDTNGVYSFSGLPVGNVAYTVAVVTSSLPAGLVNTFDPDGGNNSTSVVTLTGAAPTNLAQDFGYRGPGSVGDTIFLDVNGNGLPDAGEGLAGVVVNLTADFDGDGDLTTVTTTTDANGVYGFSGLRVTPVGVPYTVQVVTSGLPKDGSGNPIANTTDPDGGNNSTSVTTLTSATPVNLAQDFGYRGPGSIGDTIFLDVNNNGVADAGEGITGVRVSITTDVDNDGNPDTFTTLTDANGVYRFDNLPVQNPAGTPLSYLVVVDSTTLPATVVTTPTVDPDTTLDGRSSVTLTGPTFVNLAQDFGYRGPGSIGDTIFLDVNNNGVADPGEGIAGVTVTLTADMDNDGLPETVTTTTDTNGVYSFSGLPVGNVAYTVAVVTSSLPAGLVNTFDPDGGNNSTSVVTLTGAAPVNLAQDFGYRGPGAIGDTVFLDVNGNGLPDAGEGLAGVVVNLTADFDGDGDLTTVTTTTDVNGVYGFSGLRVTPVGVAYTVTVVTSGLPKDGSGNPIANTTDPDGGNNSTSVTTLTSATPVNLAQDFGYRGPGSIGDTIFLDVNGNNAFDPGEGLTGVRVTITTDVDNDGTPDTFSATTDANGVYLFNNLPIQNPTGTPLIYAVAVDATTLPGGVTNTVDPDTTLDDQSTVTLTGPTFVNLAQDFGYRGPGSIGDRIFLDLDGNGAFTPGEGLTSIRVTLTADVTGDGIPETFTATTDADGFYQFTGLPIVDRSGAKISYTVQVDSTTLPVGISNSVDPDGTTDSQSTLNLGTNPNRTDMDFGYVGTGLLGDFVFNDRNGDGRQDAGEPGFPAVRLNLTWAGQDGIFGNADDVTTTRVTDAAGAYAFGSLPPGEYRVDVVTATVPANVTITSGPGSVGTNSFTLPTPLALGEQRRTVDFGYVGSAALGDRVWYDVDGDGVQDNSATDGFEPGISGVAITVVFAGVDGDLSTTADNVTYTTTTGADGIWSLTGIPGGDFLNGTAPNYQVTVTPPAGYSVQTFDADGLATPNQSQLRLGATETNLLQDFGYRGPLVQSLGDFVYEDVNGNGVQDGSDRPLQNVAVTLFAPGADGQFDTTDDVLLDVTTTDVNGNYLFPGLVASSVFGPYQVRFTAPTGTIFTFPNVGVDDAIDSDAGANGRTGPVTVPVGAANLTVDAGVYTPISLGDRVWYDVNGNGTQDAGEPGIVGATVTLTWTDPYGQPQTRTTTTGTDGAYLFSNLPPATFTVTVSNLPSGLTAPTYDFDGTGTPNVSTVVGLSGQPITTQDFGYRGTGSLGDRVWYDLDRNGVQNNNEPGISGVQLNVTWAGQDGQFGTADDVTYPTLTTTATGDYLLQNLPSGNFRATVVPASLPVGVTQATYDLDSQLTNPDLTTLVTLAIGQARTDVDFGFTGNGSIGDRIWLDQNGNSLDDSEPGVPNVTVRLTWAGPDGLFNGTDDVVLTRTTDATGAYRFDNLPPGNYQVTVDPSTVTPGLTLSADPQGPFDGSSLLTLAANQVNLTQDFGYRGTSALSGKVYVDLNENGLLNPGEPGIGNVIIRLSGTDVLGNPVTAQTTTAADGTFLFPNLVPGSYTLNETQPAAYGDGLEASGTVNGVPSGVVTSDRFANIVLPAGQSGVNYLFGEVGSSLAGTVYFDANRNGDFDTGETGIGGVTITLTGVDLTGAVINRTTTTAPDGTYSFTGLAAGTYTLTETQPAAYLDGLELVGTAGGSNSTDDVISSIVLGPAVKGTRYLFGERPPITAPSTTFVSGVVFNDRNRDGLPTSGEPGIAGVTVQLIGPGNTVVATTTTAADGSYLFTDVIPGDYTIRETQPTGVANTPTGPFQANDRPVTVPSTGLTAQNFGEVYGTISGSVFLDPNNNGQFEPGLGESGIAGVLITLSGIDTLGNSIVRTAATDSAGNFSFVDLVAGTYTLVESQPAGLVSGINTAGPTGGTVPPSPADSITQIPLVAGGSAPANTFAELFLPPQPNTTFVAGTVYLDRNSNATQDPTEPGLAGVTIELVGPNGVVVATQTTASNGSYLFTGIAPGSYTIREVQPAQFGSSTPNLLPVTVPATGLLNQNFGEVPGTLTGSVYADRNNNGARDANEPGIAGVTVTLVNATSGATIATTTTATDGSYRFADLPAGSYRIVETQPAGYGDGLDAVGSVGGTLVSPDTIDVIPLPPGGNGVNYLFGEIGSALSGTVYLDQNRDSTYQTGSDQPLNGILLTLRDVNGNVLGSTRTAADGSYSFLGLPAGTYLVDEQQPTGYGNSETPTNRRTVVVPANTTVTNQNFGDTLAALSGLVYVDRNVDGAYNVGEDLLSGVTVTLTGTDVNGATVNRTTTTGTNGSYLFDGLLQGTYTLTETQPPRYTDGPDTVGSANGTLVPPDTVSRIPLGAGQVGTGYNFGERGFVTVSGRVFNDRDRSGVQNGSEPGIPGVTVQLIDANNQVIATTVTGANGDYQFTNVAPGQFTIRELQPTGYGNSPVGAFRANDRSITVVDTNITGQNFADTLGTLSGTVYRDFNLNGVFDGADSNPDTGIAGITLTLRNAAGTVLAVQTTDAQGRYRFEDLPAGVYSIEETQPPLPTSLDNGFYDGADSVGSLGGSSPAKNKLDANVPAGADGVSYNFGELPPADPFGYVYVDKNLNGRRDAGEPGIPNVAITLSGTAFANTIFARPLTAADVPGGALTVLTDANGRWEFNPIPPGLYSVTEAQPAGYTDGAEENADPNGPFTVVVGNDVFSNIVLAPFPVRGPFNFGEEIRPQVVGPLLPLDFFPPTAVSPPPAVTDVSKREFLGSTTAPVTQATTVANSAPVLPTAPNFATFNPSSTRSTVYASVGQDGGSGIVRVFDFAEGIERFRFQPFGNFSGGVRVANADVTGDGIPDIIVGAGPGGGPRVAVFDGSTGQVTRDFFVFESSFRGGLWVAAADINGDGRADIIVTPDTGGGPVVRGYDGATGTEIVNFLALDETFRGGLRPALGDVNNDGTADLIVTAGVGGGPRVAGYDGRSLTTSPSRLFADFFAFAPELRNGYSLSAGDVDGDGYADIVIGAGPGGGPRVAVYSGRSLVVSNDPRVLSNFFAGDEASRAGVRVSARDLNGDGRSELVAAVGSGVRPETFIYDLPSGNRLDWFYAFPTDFFGGVNVG